MLASPQERSDIVIYCATTTYVLAKIGESTCSRAENDVPDDAMLDPEVYVRHGLSRTAPIRVHDRAVIDFLQKIDYAHAER